MATPSTAPSTQATPPFDLRLGVIRAGRVTVDQRAPLKRPLGLGAAGLTDEAPVVVVVPGEGGPMLRATRSVRIRVRRAGQIKRWLLTAGSPALPIAVGDQVRVDVKDAALLIQVLPLRATVAAPEAPFDMSEFRPLLLEPGDPLYLGLVSFFGAVAMALLVVVANTPVVELEVEQVFEPPERIVMVLRPPVVEVVPEVNDAVEPATEPTPEQADLATAPSRAPERGEPDAVDVVAAVDARTAPKSTPASVVALRRVGAVADLFGPSELDAAMDQALDRIGAENLAMGAKGGGGPPMGLVGVHRGGTRKDATVDLSPSRGQAGRSGGRVTTVQPDPDHAPRKRAPSVALIPPPALQASAATAQVNRFRRKLKGCYQRALKLDPNLSGRLELFFEIDGEVVVDLDISGDTTGSRDLAACIEQDTWRWRATGVPDGAFTLPLVFEAG